jgi:nicotinamidase/pyrazinamidase
MDKAILVVDMSNDFVHPEGSVSIPQEFAKPALENAKKLIDFAREKDWKIVYVPDTHEKDDFESCAKLRGLTKHCIRGTWGWQVAEQIAPKEDDVLVEKIKYSGFLKTKLDETLKNLGIKELFVIGVYSSICVLCTTIDAHQRDYKVTIIKDCMAADTLENNNRGIATMEDVCHTKAIVLTEFLEKNK